MPLTTVAAGTAQLAVTTVAVSVLFLIITGAGTFQFAVTLAGVRVWVAPPTVIVAPGTVQLAVTTVAATFLPTNEVGTTHEAVTTVALMVRFDTTTGDGTTQLAVTATPVKVMPFWTLNGPVDLSCLKAT